MKKEYQRRVSPIVRKGGLLCPTHKPMMKAKNIIIPTTLNSLANLRYLGMKISPAPDIQSRIVGMAKHIN